MWYGPKIHICSKPSSNINNTQNITKYCKKNYEGVKISLILMQLNPKFKVFCDNFIEHASLFICTATQKLTSQNQIRPIEKEKKNFNWTLPSISPMKEYIQMFNSISTNFSVRSFSFRLHFSLAFNFWFYVNIKCSSFVVVVVFGFSGAKNKFLAKYYKHCCVCVRALNICRSTAR